MPGQAHGFRQRTHALQFMERLNQLLHRIESYPPREVLVELVVIWLCVYIVMRYLRGSRGARVMKGLAIFLLVLTPIIKLASSEAEYERLNFLFGLFLNFAALTLVIVFQPELRRALTRLGEARLFSFGTKARTQRVVDEVTASISYLSNNKVGALIAFERNVPLDGVVEAGTPLDSAVSRELLNTIFWPGSALHDMAVLIREDRIVAAGVQLPLADGEHFSSELGSRHRAAIGLTQETDALVVVVSEETGIISIVQRGQMVRNLSPDAARTMLARGLGTKDPAPAPLPSGS